MSVTDKVKILAAPVCDECGVRLWNVEFKKEGSEFFLRIYIDKPEGIAITDCENVSRKLDPILDEADPITQSYYLEVSSAGLTRELCENWHFDEYMGREVILNTYKSVDGRPKKIDCTLAGYDDDNIKIIYSGIETAVNRKDISKIVIDLF
ncbi:MAG: ribosome maturation factor [Clostridiales bacterium]|nr:MAG: ribosome maturation factor [Clostridiales bacterium]